MQTKLNEQRAEQSKIKHYRIGRASDNDVVYPEPMVSGHHAVIEYDADRNRMMLTDISMNGTYVNGRKIHHESCPVTLEDRIVLPGGVSFDWSRIIKNVKRTVPMDSFGTTPMDRVDLQPRYRDSGPLRRGSGDGGFGQRSGAGQYGGPSPSMSFGAAVSSVFSHYADFSGRARRSEYWWFSLFTFIVGCVIMWVPVLPILWSLGIFIPSLAVCVRRLHDIGKSGWNMLFMLIPLVGAVLLIIWFCKDGDNGVNEYGSDPKRSSR